MLYVINLDTDSKRWADISERLKEYSINFERISAFDGRDISKEYLNNIFFKRHKVNLTDNIGGSQVGCFLSHFSIWEKVAHGKDNYSFIFEDDIHLSPDIKKFIESDIWLPNDFDIIRLEVSTNRLLLSKDKKTTFFDRNIHQLNSTSWCAGAYVLSKECARKLISFQMDKFISADAYLFCLEISEIAKQLNIYQISPALAIQDKFKLDQEKVGYESNIEDFSIYKKIKYKILNNINKLSIIQVFLKHLKGYKKVIFQ